MKIATTRCCSCGDEISVGADSWIGAYEDETACSMLCRYRSIVSATDGWTTSVADERARGLARVAAAKEALLYNPMIFSDYEPLVATAYVEDAVTTLTAPMVVLDVTNDGVHLEVVGGEWEGSDVTLRWDEIVDVRINGV